MKRRNGAIGGMTEPLPTYTAVSPNAQLINEKALTIAAGQTGKLLETARGWVQDALNGTIPMRATYGWEVWICYQTAVSVYEEIDEKQHF